MSKTIVTALIGAMGGAAAALVGHFLAPEAERRELLEDARRDAYVDWLEIRESELEGQRLMARAESAEVSPEDAEGLRKKARRLFDEYDRKGSNIVSRVAIYGEPAVVDAMATMFNAASPDTAPCDHRGWREDIELYQRMRHSLMPDQEAVSGAVLANLVLKCSVPGG